MSTVSGHPSFWPCGVHLYVDTPIIFDHLIVNYICYCFIVVKINYWLEVSVFCTVLIVRQLGPLYLNRMFDFNAKMHQIRFRLGFRPRSRWGSLQRSPDPLAGFKGLLLRGGRGGKGREGKNEIMKGREGEGRGKGRGRRGQSRFLPRLTPLGNSKKFLFRQTSGDAA